MHKKHIHLFLPVTILNSKVKYRSFFYRKISQVNLSTPNHADTEIWALLCIKNIEKMCFWRPFLVLFIWRWRTPGMLFDRFELRTPFLREKILYSNVEQSSMFFISTQNTYKHFQKKATIFSHLKKMYVMYRSSYQPVSGIYISGFRNPRSII